MPKIGLLLNKPILRENRIRVIWDHRWDFNLWILNHFSADGEYYFLTGFFRTQYLYSSSIILEYMPMNRRKSLQLIGGSAVGIARIGICRLEMAGFWINSLIKGFLPFQKGADATQLQSLDNQLFPKVFRQSSKSRIFFQNQLELWVLGTG